MAEMPRGGSRSVSDQRGERVQRHSVWPDTRRSPSALVSQAFLPFEALDALRRAPRLSPTMTIGDQTYREVDNGRAGVLVPAEDALYTPAELAALRQGFERASYQAGHTFGTVASGAATLAGAPQPVRDGLLLAGGLADDTISGVASRRSPGRRPTTTPGGQVAPPTLARPNIRYRERNTKGQATGVTATVTAPMIGAGTRARRNPPGWQGDGRRHNEARAHLLAELLGGSGTDLRNLVTLTHVGANTPQMRGFEVEAAHRARAGEVLEYTSTPLYNEGVLAPSAILLTTQGSREAPTARIIQNPAGRRR